MYDIIILLILCTVCKQHLTAVAAEAGASFSTSKEQKI